MRIVVFFFSETCSSIFIQSHPSPNPSPNPAPACRLFTEESRQFLHFLRNLLPTPHLLESSEDTDKETKAHDPSHKEKELDASQLEAKGVQNDLRTGEEKNPHDDADTEGDENEVRAVLDRILWSTREVRQGFAAQDHRFPTPLFEESEYFALENKGDESLEGHVGFSFNDDYSL